MINRRRLFLLSLLLLSTSVTAAPSSLQELLASIKNARPETEAALTQRELTFNSDYNKQQQLLAAANNELRQATQQHMALKKTYDDYVQKIAQAQTQLTTELGEGNTLAGIVREVAAQLDNIIDHSLVSAEKPGRDTVLDDLANNTALPSLAALEELWLLAMDEMVASSDIVKFSGKVITAAGGEVEQQVTRIGVFNAVSNGRFLRYLPGTGKLIEPGRQPALHYVHAAEKFETATSGLYPFPIDPTRGEMLALLVQLPDLRHRIQQGGIIGYIVIVIGLIGLVIALWRGLVLTRMQKTVTQQLKQETAADNPLGRIIKVYQSNPDIDTETLSLKLDEAILKELPPLQYGLNLLALLAAIAPLLGLLGTVTGIIETFQAITLYGTGDPRVMSGGISQALTTTVMGLIVAVPLLLLHSFLTAKSNHLIQILDEKSAAQVALLASNRLT